PGDIGEESLGYGGARFPGGDVIGAGISIPMLDQKPLCALCAIQPGPHQGPGSPKLGSVERKLQSTGAKGCIDIRNLWDPVSAIPNHHRSAAVFSFRNHTLKGA